MEIEKQEVSCRNNDNKIEQESLLENSLLRNDCKLFNYQQTPIIFQTFQDDLQANQQNNIELINGIIATGHQNQNQIDQTQSVKSKKQKLKNKESQVVQNQIPQTPLLNPWKDKLTHYEQLFLEELKKGLFQYTIQFNETLLEQQLTEFKSFTTICPQSNDMLQKMLAQLLDSKDAYDLKQSIQQCREQIIQKNVIYEAWSEEEFENFIGKSVADRRDYLQNIKHPFSVTELPNLRKFYIWEAKDSNMLNFISDINDVNNCRRIRNHQRGIYDSLHKLILNIKKAKDENDLQKINQAYDRYNKTINKEIKLIQPKPLPTSGIKKQEYRCLDKKIKRLRVKSNDENSLSLSENEQHNNILYEERSKNASDNEDVQLKAEKLSKISQKTDKSQKSILNFFQLLKNPQQQQQQTSQSNMFKGIGSAPKYGISSLVQNNYKFKEFMERMESYDFELNEEIKNNDLQNFCRNKLIQIQLLTKILRRDFEFLQCKQKLPRFVFRYFNDSEKKNKNILVDFQSKRINGRRPFSQDIEIFDYEIDSEEEFEENVRLQYNQYYFKNSKQKILVILMSFQMMKMKMMILINILVIFIIFNHLIKFIVPDGYLSEDELNSDYYNTRNFQTIPDSQLSKTKDIIQQSFFLIFDDYEVGKDLNIDEFIENSKIIRIRSQEEIDEHIAADFPIQLKKKQNKSKQQQSNDQIFQEQNVKKDLILLMHGHYGKKLDIIQEFKKKYPQISKNLIQEEIKQIGKKEKLKGDIQERFVVNKAEFEKLNMPSEYEKILESKTKKYELSLKNFSCESSDESSILYMDSSQQPQLSSFDFENEEQKNQCIEFAKLIQGSYSQQSKLINDFYRQSYVKKSWLKKIFQKLAVKLKRPGDVVKRFYIKQEVIEFLVIFYIVYMYYKFKKLDNNEMFSIQTQKTIEFIKENSNKIVNETNEGFQRDAINEEVQRDAINEEKQQDNLIIEIKDQEEKQQSSKQQSQKKIQKSSQKNTIDNYFSKKSAEKSQLKN